MIGTGNNHIITTWHKLIGLCWSWLQPMRLFAQHLNSQIEQSFAETLHHPQLHLSRSAMGFMYAYSCSNSITYSQQCVSVSFGSSKSIALQQHDDLRPNRLTLIFINMLSLLLSWFKYTSQIFIERVWERERINTLTTFHQILTWLPF